MYDPSLERSDKAMDFKLDFGLPDEPETPPVVESAKPTIEKNEKGELTFEGDLSELLERFAAAKSGSTKSPNPKVKPSKAKPSDKTFVAYHYRGTENDSFISKRNPAVQAMIHYFTRAGDTWVRCLNDAKDDKKYHPDWKIIAHDHAFNEPCSPSEKAKCREI